MSSRCSSRRAAAAVLGVPLPGAAGCGGGAPSGRGDSSWASPGGQHVDFAECDLTVSSASPPGEPPASDDDGDHGSPGAS